MTANYKKGEMMIVSTCGEVTVTVIISLTSNAINDDAGNWRGRKEGWREGGEGRV